jgi:hypothetical protein
MAEEGGYDPARPVGRLFIGNRSKTNPRKAKIYLDNICLAKPRSEDKKASLKWTELTDPTGISTYAFCFDQALDTEPAEEKGIVTNADFDIPDAGKWFFHVRARDGAGNWGETAHYPVE